MSQSEPQDPNRTPAPVREVVSFVALFVLFGGTVAAGGPAPPPADAPQLVRIGHVPLPPAPFADFSPK